MLMNATPMPEVKRRLLFAQESSETLTATTPLVVSAATPHDDNYAHDDDADESHQLRSPPLSLMGLIEAVFEMPTSAPQSLFAGNLSSLDESEDGVRKILITTFKLERFMVYGVALCLDQLLTLTVVLPVRLPLELLLTTNPNPLLNKQIMFDVCLAIIILTALVCSMWLISAAQIYHSIRLQTFMKLYVVINIAEVVDRLLCSVGNDLFDLLADSVAQHHLGKLAFRTALCSVYACAHSILFYVRVLTLSVAMNSSSDALFTILVSNNFVELKGSVFKRSTEENLFQISCSDVVERFVIMVFMTLVGLSEFAGSGSPSLMSAATAAAGMGDDEGDEGMMGGGFRTHDNAAAAAAGHTFSSSSSLVPQFLLLWSTVLAVELAVDWIKHSFICRFNSDIRAKEAYDKFLAILATDLKANQQTLFPQVVKRLGLPVVPLCVVLLRVVFFDVPASWNLVSSGGTHAAGESRGGSIHYEDAAAAPMMMGGEEEEVAMMTGVWAFWVMLWLVGLGLKLVMRATCLRWIVSRAVRSSGGDSGGARSRPAAAVDAFCSPPTTPVPLGVTPPPSPSTETTSTPVSAKTTTAAASSMPALTPSPRARQPGLTTPPHSFPQKKKKQSATSGSLTNPRALFKVNRFDAGGGSS